MNLKWVGSRLKYIILLLSTHHQSSLFPSTHNNRRQDAIQSDAYHSLDKNSKYLLLPLPVQMMISDWFPTKLESLYHRNSQGMTEERRPVIPQNDKKNFSVFSLDRSILDCTSKLLWHNAKGGGRVGNVPLLTDCWLPRKVAQHFVQRWRSWSWPERNYL